MEARKKLYREVLLLMLSIAFFFAPYERAVHAHNSKEWKERLSARTATLWIEGEHLGDGIVLNSRGELNVTWLERGLSRILSSDNDVDEWVVNGLNYYFSNRKEIRAQLKGRDVFVLNYRASKNWSFDPCKLTFNGYAITPDDILTRKEYWESELPTGSSGTIEVTAASIKPGQTVELRYEDAETHFEVPSNRIRVK